MSRRRRVLLLIAIALIGAAAWWGTRFIPDRWKPWAPLQFADAPNIFTNQKLQRLRTDHAQCLGLLAQSKMRYSEVPDRTMGGGCAFRDVVRVASSEVSYSNDFAATCALAAGLALFERHVVAPAATELFGQPVARIEHLGTYACRNVNNRKTGALSQHATANAIDLAAFVLEDGTRISVRQDWPPSTGAQGPEGRFLLKIHAGACRIFNTVLGPDYNAAHHDHFHLDMGRYSICR